MADIQRGDTFADGQVVNGSRLNGLVDNAVLLPGAIDGKPAASSVNGTDELLIYQGGNLKKCTATQLTSTTGHVTSVGLAMPTNDFNVTGSPVTGSGTLTAAWKPQSGNMALASPADGSSGVPGMRNRDARDFRLPSFNPPASDIDWNKGPIIWKGTGTSDLNLTFSNSVDGAEITVAILHQNGKTAHWPAAVQWPGGTEPNPTSGVTIYKFLNVATAIFGYIAAQNLS